MNGFPKFGKIPRWNREVTVTEKIDGTNGVIAIAHIADIATQMEWGYPVILAQGPDDLVLYAGSRNRWLTVQQDNHGFAEWAFSVAPELFKLGPGVHYGEWYGRGIQRGYGLNEKRFMLFNQTRWADPEVRPSVCEVSTVLWQGNGHDVGPGVAWAEAILRHNGSYHVPGYDRPEGLVIYHHASNSLFKVTLENDAEPKSVHRGQ